MNGAHWSDKTARHRPISKPTSTEHSLTSKVLGWATLLVLFVGIPLGSLILYLGVRPEAPNLREMQPSQHMGVSLSLPGNWVVEDGESQIWDEIHGVTTVRISNLSILEVATVPAAIGRVGLEHSVNDYLDFMWECMETGRSREALKHHADGWAIASIDAIELDGTRYRIEARAGHLPDGRIVMLRTHCPVDRFDLNSAAVDAIAETITIRD